MEPQKKGVHIEKIISVILDSNIYSVLIACSCLNSESNLMRLIPKMGMQ